MPLIGSFPILVEKLTKSMHFVVSPLPVILATITKVESSMPITLSVRFIALVQKITSGFFVQHTWMRET